MNVKKYPCKLCTPTAVALGRFDGVHLAHQAVIKSASECKNKGLTPTVFTFCDNPNKAGTYLLTTESEKQELIKNCGAEIMVNATFESVKNLSAEEFVHDVLIGDLGAKAVFCGYNYRFGKGASADAETLRVLCEKEGVSVTCIREILIEDNTVSSTAIRNFLAEGHVADVKNLLGRSYSLSGTVIHGNGIGRTMETPTLNLDVSDEKLLPKFGVYASLAHIDGRVCKSVTNIGIKPTVGSDRPTVETFLLDECGDFYGKDVTLELIDFLRPEQMFEDLQALKDAIAKDIEKTEAILA